MGGALSVFVLLSLSIFIVRVASVALRITGLDESSARFQALSAFSGTGFTTLEAEAIVNYPVRRKIISLLMIIGNVGLVGVFATVAASLVHTDGELAAVLRQIGWLLAVLAVLWFFILNRRADRLMCGWISRFLKARTVLGKRPYQRLLQLGSGVSICEHPVPPLLMDAEVLQQKLERLKLEAIAIRTTTGQLKRVSAGGVAEDAAAVILLGDDAGHEGVRPLDS